MVRAPVVRLTRSNWSMVQLPLHPARRTIERASAVDQRHLPKNMMPLAAPRVNTIGLENTPASVPCAEGIPPLCVDVQGDQEICPVCVALNVLLAGHPPSTVGSR